MISCYLKNYLSNNINDQISTINKFNVKIHLINDLKINLLINNDVFIAQRVKFNLIIQSVELNSCQNLIASIDIIIEKKINLKRII